MHPGLWHWRDRFGGGAPAFRRGSRGRHSSGDAAANASAEDGLLRRMVRRRRVTQRSRGPTRRFEQRVSTRPSSPPIHSASHATVRRCRRTLAVGRDRHGPRGGRFPRGLSGRSRRFDDRPWREVLSREKTATSPSKHKDQILERSFAPAASPRAAKANSTAISRTSTKCALLRPACSKPRKSSAPLSKAAMRWGRSAKALSLLPFPAGSEVWFAEGRRSPPHR